MYLLQLTDINFYNTNTEIWYTLKENELKENKLVIFCRSIPMT